MPLLKYSVLMPYFDRLELMQITAESFVYHYADRDDVEFIIIEDCKNFDGLKDWLDNSDITHRLNIRHIRESGNHRWWTACHLYNQAACAAKGAYLVITCPECFHRDNILIGLDKVLSNKPTAYVNCACMDIVDYQITEPMHFMTMRFTEEKWLQHSEMHHRMLNYCTAVSKAGYKLIGGFDERLSPGYACGDNDFRDRMVLSGLPIVNKDNLVTLHLPHPPITHYLDEAYVEKLNNQNKEIWHRDMEERGHYSDILKDRAKEEYAARK